MTLQKYRLHDSYTGDGCYEVDYGTHPQFNGKGCLHATFSHPGTDKVTQG